jgi:hypothetical protein
MVPETLQPQVYKNESISIPPVGHPGYLLNSKSYNYNARAVFFNVLGIIFAIFVAYFIISTDSNIYLLIWVCYSVLRKMIGKSRTAHLKVD